MLCMNLENGARNRYFIRKGKGKIMKECVNIKELLEEVDAMAKRGTLLARGGVKQEDLAMQIKGLIVHVAMKEETE